MNLALQLFQIEYDIACFFLRLFAYSQRQIIIKYRRILSIHEFDKFCSYQNCSNEVQNGVKKFVYKSTQFVPNYNLDFGGTRWIWKCHIIIVIKTDLAGFDVT